MTVFLILIVLGLLVITAWQISKIFELSKNKKSETPGGVNDNRDNRIQGYIMLAFGIAFYGFMIFNFWEYSKLYPPKAASTEGVQLDILFYTTAIVIMLVQEMMQSLIFNFDYKYNRKKSGFTKSFSNNDNR